MLEPEDYRRIAEACRSLAERSGGRSGQTGSDGSYLIALAERFNREEAKALRTFAGTKPQQRRSSSR